MLAKSTKDTKNAVAQQSNILQQTQTQLLFVVCQGCLSLFGHFFQTDLFNPCLSMIDTFSPFPMLSNGQLL